MGDTRTCLLAFTAETCCVAGCGVSWMMEAGFMSKRRADGKDFYCPNGHAQHYGVTTEERLRRELAAKEGQLTSAKNALEWKESLLATARRSRAAIRGRLGSVMRRVHAGVCPHCRRSFQNVKRHMETKHPPAAGKGGVE